MTVFVWTSKPVNPDALTKDEFATSWATPSPRCFLCGEVIQSGQRAWHWHSALEIVAHAECVKKQACGMMKDIAECLR